MRIPRPGTTGEEIVWNEDKQRRAAEQYARNRQAIRPAERRKAAAAEARNADGQDAHATAFPQAADAGTAALPAAGGRSSRPGSSSSATTGQSASAEAPVPPSTTGALRLEA